MLIIVTTTLSLGAGKTTIILSLLKQLPKDYKVCLLKNEFGDVEVDSELAKESSIEAVSEILNGCMCCVLVGQMRTALLEIKEKYSPDRIIIESSGSAFPATLAWQVRQLKDEGLKLDDVVTVIDCLNFKGYEDNSPTAKMQAKYTDLLLLNKHELTTERQLDSVLDSLYELNPETPKLRISRDDPPAPSLIFGLLAVSSSSSEEEDGSAKSNGKQSKVFGMKEEEIQEREKLGLVEGEHANEEKGEVETVSIWSGGSRPGHSHDATDASYSHKHEHEDHDSIDQATSSNGSENSVSTKTLEVLLAKLPSEDIWRVKGFLLLSSSTSSSSSSTSSPKFYILNWAFGRHELHQASEGMAARLREQGVKVRLTMMGARGEVKKRARVLAGGLGASVA